MDQSKLNQISEHVYWLAPDSRTDRPILGAISGKNATLIVDAGNSPAHAKILLDELAKIKISNPKFVALTHWHWDHVFGSSAFDMPIFSSRDSKLMIEKMSCLDWNNQALKNRVDEGTEIEFCRDMIMLEWPDLENLKFKPPDIGFDTNLEFDLGGVTCLFKHVGGDHSIDSSVVYILEDNIVFLGDCLYEDLHHGNPNYTSEKLFPLIDDLLSFNAEYYLWAHDPVPMSMKEMVNFTDRLKTIGKEVERTGKKREFIINSLHAIFNEPLDERDLEMVDAFLNGLSNKEY